MRRILIIIIAGLLAWSPAASQTRKNNQPRKKHSSHAVKASPPAELENYQTDTPPPLPPSSTVAGADKSNAEPDVFRTSKIGKWGVASLDVPQALSAEINSTDVQTREKITMTTFERDWQRSAVSDPATLEAILVVHTFDGSLSELFPDLKPAQATPEYLLRRQLASDTDSKDSSGILVTDVRRLNVGGIDGEYNVLDWQEGRNRRTFGWTAYRYYKGKAQLITLTVRGGKDEAQTARRIIESLKFDAAAGQ